MSSILKPSYEGYVGTPDEARRVVQGCVMGILHHAPRRMRKSEEAELIQSGNVFVVEKNASGIEEWVDSVDWNASEPLKKKTFTVTMHGHRHHVTSYYTDEDIRNHRLQIPSCSVLLQNI
ncbi:hypothetical protein L228DRAFT_268020 [Xylona heveae TC161]|uniref:Uncharacterized protein n=1 Tax=Xylona heveae (strain CBS 132557 / TC161) TaxID=1328760 RepID=A0A165GV23_XYLHT|nr:hypothetical protein L228DRAFT_268020 [Xylona heveae TC161]KZF22631.1 hypothetical protein L228DRAFT_268020 [Xylona heveae TC161]